MPKQNKPQVIIKVKGGINPKTKQVEGQPISENGVIVQPGEQIAVDADRADALAHNVEIVGPAPDSSEKAA